MRLRVGWWRWALRSWFRRHVWHEGWGGAWYGITGESLAWRVAAVLEDAPGITRL